MSSIFRKELLGERNEIIRQINAYSQTLRPLGKVVGLEDSPARSQKHLCTLLEVESPDGETQTPIVLARPINGRLPLFQVSKVPEELLKDRRMQRDISHRYYFLEHRDW